MNLVLCSIAIFKSCRFRAHFDLIIILRQKIFFTIFENFIFWIAYFKNRYATFFQNTKTCILELGISGYVWITLIYNYFVCMKGLEFSAHVLTG